MNEIEPAVRLEIEQLLARIASDNSVRLLMAIESGSRAWGFPSPDSDYDVRFIYIRNSRDYLSLQSIRDVIELPISDDLDINGWDIRKALHLVMKHNAVVAEWMDSSIRYLADDPIMAQIADFADRYFDPQGYARHYASLGTNNLQRLDLRRDDVPVKRYFYSLRPALSVRALRLDPEKRPPMRLQDLMAATDLSDSMVREIEHLVELKARTREADVTKRSPLIEALIADELGRASEVNERKPEPTLKMEADDIFWQLLHS